VTSKGSAEESTVTHMSIANDIEADIVRYLRAHHGFDVNEITHESTRADLGPDSLGMLAIGDIFENKYGIAFDDERIAWIRTYSDFNNRIRVKQSKRPTASNPVDKSTIGLVGRAGHASYDLTVRIPANCGIKTRRHAIDNNQQTRVSNAAMAAAAVRNAIKRAELRPYDVERRRM
jgi:acyl carrier protein